MFKAERRAVAVCGDGYQFSSNQISCVSWDAGKYHNSKIYLYSPTCDLEGEVGGGIREGKAAAA